MDTASNVFFAIVTIAVILMFIVFFSALTFHILDDAFNGDLADWVREKLDKDDENE